MTRRAALATVVIVAGLASLAACAAPDDAVSLGDGRGVTNTHVCPGALTEPVTFGQPFDVADGAEVVLRRVALENAVGVRVAEEAIARAAILDDGTHLGVGFEHVRDAGEPWRSREPLADAVLRGDDTGDWFIALAIERTEDGRVGFDAITLTYADSTGIEHTVRGNMSLRTPCEEEEDDDA